MLRPDEFLTAQRVQALRPHARDVIASALEKVGAGEASSVLDELVLSGLVNPTEASEVAAAVRADVAARAVEALVAVAVEAGLPGEQVEACARVSEGVTALGAALVQTGLLAPDREPELRRQAAERYRIDLERAAAAAWPIAGGVPVDAAAPEGPATRPYDANDLAASLADAGFELQLGGGGDADLPDQATEAYDPAELMARLDADEDDDDELRDRPTDAFDSQALAARLADDDDAEFAVPAGVDSGDPRVGEQVGAFTIAGRIGAGAMGVVYLARDPDRAATPIALKLLPPDASESAKGRFKREILANGFFDHEGALGIYDAGETEAGEHFLAMEYFAGKDLGRTLDEFGRLPPAAAVQVAIHVLDTLAVAHQAGVVHRDVKPDNILVAPGGREVRLMDFGIAIIRDLGEFQQQVFQSFGTGQVIGTPEYISPEQASGMEAGPESDLYSLSCVLYHCLAGRLPFQSETPTGFVTQHIMEDAPPLAEVAPHTAALPQELHALIAKLLEKDPDDRPAGPAALAILRSVLAELLR